MSQSSRSAIDSLSNVLWHVRSYIYFKWLKVDSVILKTLFGKRCCDNLKLEEDKEEDYTYIENIKKVVSATHIILEDCKVDISNWLHFNDPINCD